ncbi:MAG: TdeIII family type II restriction endonuclease [Clostridiales bacterium]|nr:TdeIII family type II restriction endonuclease [Clostridiales bacterium]
MKEHIKQIVIEEFTRVVNLIESDFKANYKRKVNNFLLSQMDERITASMVFVSSFESKSGFAIEACAKRIAKLRFGEENVPSVVNPRNLSHNISAPKNNEQIVVTDIDTNNGSLRGEIAAFRATNVASGRGKARVESKVTQESIKKELLPLAGKYAVKDSTFTKPVDLAFFDGKNWNILELKAGGDLDSSNAPSNVEKLLTLYVDMGIENCKVYFGTLYNKDGEGKTWTGAVKKHMAYPEMFLIGKNFWEKILPDKISFGDFENIYKSALEEIDLNKHINEMIEDCIGNEYI